MDRGLGLLREAGETFARALALGPGNAALAATVERLDARLHPPPPE